MLFRSPVPAIIKQNGLPQGVNKTEMFNLQEPDMVLFETFSDNLKAKITSSPEWQKMQSKPAPATGGAPAAGVEEDEDIPF